VYEGCVRGSRIRTKDPSVLLHRFPKDPEMRGKWARQIRRGCNVPNINFETGVVLEFNLFLGIVCSLHFAPYSAAEKSYAQKVGLHSPKNRRKLKPDAIPLT